MRGRIADWKDDRGFGFIEPESGGPRVFFHISETRGGDRPAIGTEVHFQLSKSADGRLRAVSVAAVGARVPPKPVIPVRAASKPRVARGRWLWIPALLVFPTLWWLIKLGKLPLALFWMFSGMSLLTFVLYGLDKWAAKQDRQRTPERTLQMCALFCGWPGALLAQQVFRHKSSKASFQQLFWFVVVVNIAAVAFLNSPLGRSLLKQ